MKKLIGILLSVVGILGQSVTQNGILYNTDTNAIKALPATVTITGAGHDGISAPGGISTGSGSSVAGQLSLGVTNTSYTLTLTPSTSQAANVRLFMGSGAGVWLSTVSGTNETLSRVALSGNSTDALLGTGVFGAVSGGSGLTTNSGVYFLSHSTSVVGPTNSTTETSIWTNTIPANAMGTDRSLETQLLLDVFNNSGSGQTTSILKVYSGSTVIYQDTIATIQNLANHIPCTLTTWFGAQGSTSSQICFVQWQGGGSGTSTTGIGEFGNILNPQGGFTTVYSNSSVDTSVARGFGVTITLGNANASFAVKCIKGQDRIW
jgi:hypothetical protein